MKLIDKIYNPIQGKKFIKNLDIIFVISLLVFSSIGLLVHKTMENNMERNIKDNLQKDAQIAASEIDTYFNHYSVLTNQMLTNITLTTYIKDVKLKDQKRKHRDFQAVVETLRRIKASDSNVCEAWIGVTAMDDIVFTDNSWDTANYYEMETRPWYLKMISDKSSPTYTDPYVDAITGDLIISVVAPVYNNNQVVGCVGVDLFMGKINDFMKSYTVGKTGYPILVSDTGMILYHPNQDLMFTTRLSQLDEQLIPLEKSMLAGKTGISEFKYGNSDKYVAYAPVKTSDFSVATVVPKSETRSPINTFNAMSFLIFVGVFIIMLVIRALIKSLINYEELSSVYEDLSAAEEELQAQYEEIEHLAYYDQLTGLPNRVLFEERVAGLINSAETTSNKFAILYFDLDDFKRINDSAGHIAGDILLKYIAQMLKEMSADISLIARMSGDEFAMLILNSQETNIRTIANQIRDAFREPWNVQDTLHYLSCSLGIAIYPEDGQTYDELLKNADTAMYAVKKKGKNDWHKFNILMQTELNAKLEMERHLRTALANGEMAIHYQPLVEAKTSIIRGFEALMRWKSPIYGWVPPHQFIPLLEETSLIKPFGEWMALNACQQNYNWQQKHQVKTVVSVNVSAMEFKQKDFVKKVTRILDVSHLEPSYLELEITESLLIDDLDNIIDILKELRQLGVKISLDDFGTGYSSLNYLSQLPIDTLKLDKTFISDINLNKKRTAVLSSIIDMAHDLKLQMVAEGVETQEQLAFLESKHCDILQGYYFYRPLPAEEIDSIFSGTNQLFLQ